MQDLSDFDEESKDFSESDLVFTVHNRKSLEDVRESPIQTIPTFKLGISMPENWGL